MKKMMKKLLVVALFLTMSGLSMAQNNKVGYINTDAVIMMMPTFDSVQQEIQTYASSLMTPEMQQKQKDLDEKYQNFQQEAQNMGEARREVVAQEITQLNNEIQDYLQKNQVQQKVGQKEAQLLAPLEQQAIETISQVAESNGFSMIMNVRSGIVYAEEGTNLMPFVMDELGVEQPPATSTTTPATPDGQ